MRIRKNGARDMLAKEYKVFERLVKAGHRDTDIADMLGRTPRGVRGIREYYGLTDPTKYKRTGAKYSIEEDKIIDRRIIDWVQCEKLTSKQMADRLAYLHPPGLHFATILRRMRRIDPTGSLWAEHRKNDVSRRSAHMARRHIKGGHRTQKRDACGHYLPRERQRHDVSN